MTPATTHSHHRTRAVTCAAAMAGSWLCAFLIAAPAIGAATAKKAGDRTAAPRTLESITIEGEVAVPQVLFITARDVRRFRDGLGKSYQKDPLALIRSVSGPTRVRMTTCNDVFKEDAP